MTDTTPSRFWPLFFRFSAIGNWSVAASVIFFPDLLYTALGISPMMSTETKFFADTFAIMAAIFGLAYWWVAADPVGHRSFVKLGIVGKTAAVAMIWFHVLFLEGPLGFGLLILGDLAFVAAFIVYLRQVPA